MRTSRWRPNRAGRAAVCRTGPWHQTGFASFPTRASARAQFAPALAHARRRHDQLYPAPARLLVRLLAVVVTDHLSVRARHGRPHHAVSGTRCPTGGRRRHPRALRPRSADLGAIRHFPIEPGYGRFRQLLLLPHARARPLSVPPAELTAAGAGGDGVFPPDRHPERHSGRRAGWWFLG